MVKKLSNSEKDLVNKFMGYDVCTEDDDIMRHAKLCLKLSKLREKQQTKEIRTEINKLKKEASGLYFKWNPGGIHSPEKHGI